MRLAGCLTRPKSRPCRASERVRLHVPARKRAISVTLRDMLRNPLRLDLPNFTVALRAVSTFAQTTPVWVKAKSKKQPLI
jgi:hypothetical protein